jgi:hypothetical protein
MNLGQAVGWISVAHPPSRRWKVDALRLSTLHLPEKIYPDLNLNSDGATAILSMNHAGIHLNLILFLAYLNPAKPGKYMLGGRVAIVAGCFWRASE